jgi:phosphoglycolate phosphatase
MDRLTSDPAAKRVLVLWDIDHTLIETRGVGLAIYQRVVPTVTGRPFERLANISGRTELDIMAETLRLNGVEPTDDAVAQLAAALVQGYEDARDELGTTGRVLPGAQEVLAKLVADPSVHQGVLTGNLREVARIKLEVFGLAQYLNLDTSAYGDDHADRAELVKIAQKRAAEPTGTWFDGGHTVLVGDTPKDVEAALTAGVRVVAVASGKSTVEQLRQAGAGLVVEDLTDTVQVVRTMLATC